MENNTQTLVGVVVGDTTFISLDELCSACTARVEHIAALVEEGILEPSGGSSNDWRFPGSSLYRARTALRLQRELEINLAGVALALELMEEVQQLRCRLSRWERGVE